MVDIPTIQILPAHIASKIAAGEVVTGAASIVKELLENALDAGSTSIKVVVDKTDCTNFIQVVDNGYGMHDQDVQLCIEAHATSKISQPEDLFSLDTYGFRGEALNAIAAVAELTIMTRTKKEELGTCLVAVDGEVKKKKPIVTPVGTKIEVRHLFGTIPGRRAFLKSNAIELKHVITTFQRIALANAHVGFAFYNGQAETDKLYDLPPTKLNRRIVDIFHKGYAKQLIPCEERTKQFHVTGYIGTPERAKKKPGEQFLFVNQRYIKNRYLNHAVKQAYQRSLHTDSYPFFVLFIHVPPDQVDVNVHPAKIEVKFQDERLLYTLILTAVKKALLMHHGMHTIDFTHEHTKALFTTPASPPTELPPTDLTSASSASQAHNTFPPEATPIPPASSPPTNAPMPSAAHTIPSSLPIPTPATHPPLLLQEPLAAPAPRSPIDPLTAKLQLHHRFILAQVTSGLLVVDQYAAYERILYERNMARFTQSNPGTQKLLFPYEVTLQPADLMLVKACKEELYTLGFRFDIHLPHTLKITGQPTNVLTLPQYNTENMLIHVITQYKTYTEMHALPSQACWARALAKRGNLAPNTTLSSKEMDALIDQLFACKSPDYTPDGDKIWHIFPLNVLATWLNTPPCDDQR
ncbi:MAG: DNA mismatch repair endonuclease MutL [Bacteroidota bacterium]